MRTMSNTKTPYEIVRERFQSLNGRFLSRFNRPGRDIFIESWLIGKEMLLVQHMEGGSVEVFGSISKNLSLDDLLKEITKVAIIERGSQ